MKRPPADPFAEVRQATDQHRARHGCGAYPYDNGPLLSVLAAAVHARRIVELGTALGYMRYRLHMARRTPRSIASSTIRST